MKRIKHNLFLSILALMGIATTISCSDKLNTQEGQLNTGDLDYTNTDNMIEPLIGAYYSLADMGREVPLLLSVRGDDVNAGGLGDQQPFADTDRYNYSKDYWMYNSLWNAQYSEIINMNTAIDQIQKFEEYADDQQMQTAEQYIAEIKVMRAWFHLNLGRTWKDVFIITTNQPHYRNRGRPRIQTRSYAMDFRSNG